MSKTRQLCVVWTLFVAASAIVVLFESGVRASAMGDLIHALLSFPGLMFGVLVCGIHGCSESVSQGLVVTVGPSIWTAIVSLFWLRKT